MCLNCEYEIIASFSVNAKSLQVYREILALKLIHLFLLETDTTYLFNGWRYEYNVDTESTVERRYLWPVYELSEKENNSSRHDIISWWKLA